ITLGVVGVTVIARTVRQQMARMTKIPTLTAADFPQTDLGTEAWATGSIDAPLAPGDQGPAGCGYKDLIIYKVSAIHLTWSGKRAGQVIETHTVPFQLRQKDGTIPVVDGGYTVPLCHSFDVREEVYEIDGKKGWKCYRGLLPGDTVTVFGRVAYEGHRRI